MVKDVRLFLQGFGNRITKSLKARMEIESDSLNFEAAARIRDQLSAIEKTLERQAVVSLDFVDRDVFSFYREGSQMEVTSLFVRSGRMIGSKSFFLKNIQLSDEEALSSFISQYYHMDEFIPNEIVVPVVLDDRSLFQEWLRDKKGSNVRILNPKRGSKKNLLKLATQNAVVMFKKNSAYDEDRETILKELKSRLYLKNYPFHIECFDISNIMGTSAVGSMIVFEGGMPLKEGYRRYSIKSVHQPNDYAMMYEVLDRHLDRVKNSGSIPDLIIVDGGKGHLNVLLKALHDKGISNIDAIAMAKGKNAYNKTASIEKEKIFLPNRKNPVMFSKKDKAFFLLVRVRDEAHRFAVSYHRTLKKKKDFSTPLENISGIGKKTVNAVLKHFGSMKKASIASIEEFADVPLITKRRAEIIYKFFHND
jgi:excinuclease ABC subunit C